MKYLTLTIYLITLLFNILGGIGTLTGYTVKDISEKYISLLTPANYTFVIWFIIYIGLLLYTLYSCSMIKNQETAEERRILSNINSYYCINLFLNILWVITWVANMTILATVFIILIFLTLYKIIMIIKEVDLKKKQKFFISVPFNLYFGWINVVMIANINVFLVKIGVNPVSFFGLFLTVLLLVLGFVLFVLIYYKNRNVLYLFSVLWGYVGIAVNNIVEFLFVYKIIFLIEIIIIFLLAYLFIKDLKKYVKYYI